MIGTPISQQTMSLGMIPLSQATVDQVGRSRPICQARALWLASCSMPRPAAPSDLKRLRWRPTARRQRHAAARAGRRPHAAPYHVAPLPSGAVPQEIVITVESTSGDFHLAGVVGAHGSAQTWAAESNGGILFPHLVPDTPLSPGGIANIRFPLRPRPPPTKENPDGFPRL